MLFHSCDVFSVILDKTVGVSKLFTRSLHKSSRTPFQTKPTTGGEHRKSWNCAYEMMIVERFVARVWLSMEQESEKTVVPLTLWFPTAEKFFGVCPSSNPPASFASFSRRQAIAHVLIYAFTFHPTALLFLIFFKNRSGDWCSILNCSKMYLRIDFFFSCNKINK